MKPAERVVAPRMAARLVGIVGLTGFLGTFATFKLNTEIVSIAFRVAA